MVSGFSLGCVSGRTRRRTGRRPGQHDTRADILAAARASFAERGYCIFNSAFSARNRSNSARSESVNDLSPEPSPAPDSFALFTHFLNVIS